MPIDLSYPAPQADRLDKLSVVVDAVEMEADTAAAIAEALAMVDRQGSYYANAAAYLGLIATVSGGSPVQFCLTEEGHAFQAAGPEMRALMLGDLLEHVPAVQAHREGGLAGAVELYEELGLDNDTAVRRAQTAGIWASSLEGAGLTAENIARESTSARTNAAAVAAAIKERRRREQAAAAPKLCPECFTALPLTGQCDDCS